MGMAHNHRMNIWIFFEDTLGLGVIPGIDGDLAQNLHGGLKISDMFIVAHKVTFY